MTVDPRLVEILACPDCRGAVRAEGGRITCQVCGRAYPVTTVPVMLVEESTPGV